MGRILGEVDRGRVVEVKSGTGFCVQLDENGTTGYTWSKPTFDGAIIELERDATMPPAIGSAIGAGGVRTFAFVARAAGKTTIRLAYRRPWEADSLAAAHYEVVIVVVR